MQQGQKYKSSAKNIYFATEQGLKHQNLNIPAAQSSIPLCATEAVSKRKSEMYIDSPVWQLKKTCPNCGQSYLVLCTCDECHNVIAVCEEEGGTFASPFDISLDTVAETGPEICPHCHTEGKIRPSKDYELIKIGLTTNDYE